MRILYVDVSTKGHHLSYMRELVKNNSDCVLILPNIENEFKVKQYIFDSNRISKNIFIYIKWICYIKKIADIENVDIIHFLYGDVMYKYFGSGLRILKKKVVITFHQIRRSYIRDLSLKFIFNKVNIGIIHTESLLEDMKQIKINNIEMIEYPFFYYEKKINKNEARVKLGLPINKVIIGAIGGTRKDKGLDILLESLSYIKFPFHLIIAGKEEFFDRKYIEEKIESYKNSVTIKMKYLSDEELNLVISSLDIIALPYRKVFDGASGPLGEGICKRKFIIGPNHGSLGSIIEKNKLGLTFEAENIESLSKTIESSFESYDEWNEIAEEYRYKLMPKNFVENYKKVYVNILN